MEIFGAAVGRGGGGTGRMISILNIVEILSYFRLPEAAPTISFDEPENDGSASATDLNQTYTISAEGDTVILIVI